MKVLTSNLLMYVVENPKLRPVLGRDFIEEYIDVINVKVCEYRQKRETKVITY
jgi:hypothetical protein